MRLARVCNLVLLPAGSQLVEDKQKTLEKLLDEKAIWQKARLAVSKSKVAIVFHFLLVVCNQPYVWTN